MDGGRVLERVILPNVAKVDQQRFSPFVFSKVGVILVVLMYSMICVASMDRHRKSCYESYEVVKSPTLGSGSKCENTELYINGRSLQNFCVRCPEFAVANISGILETDLA